MIAPGDSARQVSAGQSFDLVLASESPYRRALLERLGIPFRLKAPTCDESAFKVQESDPIRLAQRLAHAKAASLAGAGEEAGATVIGCDQVLSFEGEVFGKPGTAESAVEQLERLAGHQHDLITALVVMSGARTFRHTDLTKLWMRPLSRSAIERYVFAEPALDCAGSYKIESRGITLFDRIETEDQTAITGLPLIALVSILSELGFPIP
jgi:septum formation protein